MTPVIIVAFSLVAGVTGYLVGVSDERHKQRVRLLKVALWWARYQRQQATFPKVVEEQRWRRSRIDAAVRRVDRTLDNATHRRQVSDAVDRCVADSIRTPMATVGDVHTRRANGPSRRSAAMDAAASRMRRHGAAAHSRIGAQGV